MKEIALIVIAIIYFLTFVINWKMAERVTRLEALVKRLESEMIALRKKIVFDDLESVIDLNTELYVDD